MTLTLSPPKRVKINLSRASGIQSLRTEPRGAGLLVDFGPGDQPIGVEITAPTHTTAAQINEVLSSLDLSPMAEEELLPLKAA